MKTNYYRKETSEPNQLDCIRTIISKLIGFNSTYIYLSNKSSEENSTIILEYTNRCTQSPYMYTYVKEMDIWYNRSQRLLCKKFWCEVIGDWII
jgi:hypothetical protein